MTNGVPYFQVPNGIFDFDLNISDPKTNLPRKLSPTEKLTYIYLCRCSNNGSTAFPSYNTIADKCGISRKTAMVAVKTLTDNNLISKQIRSKDYKHSETNIYSINPPNKESGVTITPPKAKEQINPVPSSEFITPPSVTITPLDAKSGVTITPNKELSSYKELIIKNDNVTPLNLPLRPGELISFDRYLKHTYRKIDPDKIEAVNYYLEKYEQATTDKHSNLNSGQWDYVIDNILNYLDMNIYEIVDISLADMKKIIDNHFLSGKTFLIQDFVSADNMIKEIHTVM